MHPADWRTPKILYAVEVQREDGSWIQLDGITPFRDNAERKMQACFPDDNPRLVLYYRQPSSPKKVS